LIVLEIRKRTASISPFRARPHPRFEAASADEPQLRFPIRKDQFCFKHIRDPAVRRKITTGMLTNDNQTTVLDRSETCASKPPNRVAVSSPKPDALPLHNVNLSLRAARPSPGQGYRIPPGRIDRSPSKTQAPAAPCGARETSQPSN
jgi:hypothetical protein